MIRNLIGPIAVPMACLALLSACGGAGGSATGTPAPASSPTPTPTPVATTPVATPIPVVKIGTVTIAGAPQTVLTDAHGMTLYHFTPDKGGNVTCTGQCAVIWPPALLPAGTPGSSVQLPGKLDVVAGPNGRQLTYNGWPLYTYATDKAPSDVNGQGVAGKWFVVTPDIAAA